MRKPIAVLRRDYLATTGPSLFGIKRMDKVLSPRGEVFTFLGVREGEVFMKRDDKTKGEPFMIVDSSEFSKWQKKQG